MVIFPAFGHSLFGVNYQICEDAFDVSWVNFHFLDVVSHF